jgi:nucleotide-binding universal stress UspA family protein
MYERILVPLDSSNLADIVLPYAEVLAGELNSEVTLLYVCETEEEHYRRMHEFYLGKIAELVKSHVREQHTEKRDISIEVRAVVSCGKPPEEISSYAKNNNTNLIVMVYSGRSGIMRRLMAEIADKVFQATETPLLLIATKPHLEPSPLGLLDRILLPLDGLQSGEAALPYVSELTKKIAAQVTLLQVVAPVYQVRTLRGLDYIKFTKQQIESMKVNARQYLENVGKVLADTKALPQYEVRVGDPATEIISFTTETNTRLVAISTHRYSGTKQWRAEEIARKILQTTKTPVLLVKAAT